MGPQGPSDDGMPYRNEGLKFMGITLKHVKLLPANGRPKVFYDVENVVDSYSQGREGYSNSHPPRYGKTDIIRCSTLELCALGAPPSIAIVPWTILAEQIKSKTKVAVMYVRYGIPRTVPFLMHRIQSFKSSSWWRPEAGAHLLSVTIELVLANEENFLLGIRDMVEHYGMRVPVHVDEAHLAKKDKPWGKLIRRVQDAGGYAVMYTGTPVIGVEYFEAKEYGDWYDTSLKMLQRRIEGGETKFYRQTWEGRARDIEGIQGLSHVSWEEAFNANPPALAKATVAWVNADVYDEVSNELIGPLYDVNSDGTIGGGLTKDDLKGGRLRKVIEGEECVAQMAESGIRRLLVRRLTDGSMQELALTGYDVGGNSKERNRHASALRDAMRQVLVDFGYDSDHFKIGIATTVKENGEPDDEALRTVQDFIDGRIDILIVKMMGIVGVDV